jgi:hypothetical protein
LNGDESGHDNTVDGRRYAHVRNRWAVTMGRKLR